MISNKIFKKEDMIHVLMIVISALLYSLGMSVFVKSGNLFPGGYAGISRLISEVLRKFFNISLSFSVIYFLMNRSSEPRSSLMKRSASMCRSYFSRSAASFSIIGLA